MRQYTFSFRPTGLKVSKFIGDRTGVLHVGPEQVVIGEFSEHVEFLVNVFVHRNGHFHTPPNFACFGIQITTRYYNSYFLILLRKLVLDCI